MTGLYHPARDSGTITWVLLHGLGSDKEEWDTFARKLARQGNGVFIYDARGHHESNRMVGGQEINYKSFTRADWGLMPKDLAGALAMLRGKFGLPENRMGVGGASLGANVALVYASEHSAVPALLLLSSGEEYAGINIVQPWRHWGNRPTFAAASPVDSYAYQTLRALTQERTDANLRVAEGQGAEHGVNMFKDEMFTNKVLEWMKGQDGNRNRRPS